MKTAPTSWTIDRQFPSPPPLKLRRDELAQDRAVALAKAGQSETLKEFFEGARKVAFETRSKWHQRRQMARYCHPLLQAFQQATHGHITITTPEGRKVSYGEGTWPRARWQLHDWSVLDVMVTRGEVGLAETYVNGQWDSDDLPTLLTYGLLNADALEKYFYGQHWFILLAKLQNLFQKNSVTRSKKNIMDHYDLGNEFYRLWLDEGLTYSCALFEGKNRTLEEAQAAKYNRILDRLALPAGARVLEIGCGWGGFAEAASHRGLRVTGLTLSKAQKTYADARLQPLMPRPEIRLQDYRQTTGKFDGIASIGMLEHVGMGYWPNYFQTVRNRLKPGRKAMIQSIILDDAVFRRARGKYGFIEQVIFPGGDLPSKEAFVSAAEGNYGLACMNIFTFGEDYVRTLNEWLARFDGRIDQVKKLGYDTSFIRLWRFYLACCIASFASKRSSVMQAELVRI